MAGRISSFKRDYSFMRQRPTGKPIRLQLSRRKGFDLQGVSRLVNGRDAVHCGRPSIFGNFFVVGDDGDAAECVEKFRRSLRAAQIKSLGTKPGALRIIENLGRLRGKNLACWCKPDAPCHVDVLLEFASSSAAAHSAIKERKHGSKRKN